MVRYSFKEVNGTTLALVKSTELSSCTNRHQLYSIIPLTPYVFQKVNFSFLSWLHSWFSMFSWPWFRLYWSTDHGENFTSIYCFSHLLHMRNGVVKKFKASAPLYLYLIFIHWNINDSSWFLYSVIRIAPGRR